MDRAGGGVSEQIWIKWTGEESGGHELIYQPEIEARDRDALLLLYARDLAREENLKISAVARLCDARRNHISGSFIFISPIDKLLFHLLLDDSP